MKLMKNRPLTPAKSLNRFFDEFFNNDLSNFVGRDFFISEPSVNVQETEQAFNIELAAPGMEKEDFNVKIENDYLIITAERKKDEEVKEDNYMRREFNFATFKRSFSLPENIDSEGIGAKYENGVLYVTLPKTVASEDTSTKVIDIT